MKILVCNSFYYVRGGAEQCALDLEALLRSNGHEVISFSMDHHRNLPSPYSEYFVSHIDYPELLKSVTPANIFKATERITYSREAREKVDKLIGVTNPDIAHVHNVGHELSPSVLYGLANAKIPIVMSLHDYGLLCPNTSFLSHGEICERCKEGKFYQVVLRRCKRNSLPASLLAGWGSYLHTWLGSFNGKVDIFFAPSKFLREKMIKFGFDPKKIIYLPNTIKVDDFQPAAGHGDYILYFGRLSKEKGLFTLLEAMTRLPNTVLKLAGEGPMEEELRAFVRQHNLDNVDFVGYQSGEALHNLIRKSSFVVVPSTVYENAPLVCLESMALGRPVIGSYIGGIPELVKVRETGLLFDAGNAEDLYEKMVFLLDNPEMQLEWGRNARRWVETSFDSKTYYGSLMEIYQNLVSDTS